MALVVSVPPFGDRKMSEEAIPEVRVGDTVVYWSDPFNENCKKYIGWCLSPAIQNNAVNLLVFTDEVGFVERIAVRHRLSQELREKPSIAALGAWDLSQQTRDLQKLTEMKMNCIAESEKAAIRTKTGKK